MMRPVFVLLFLLGFLCRLQADVAVLTQHNDLARTGANLNETVLKVSNVDTSQFGLRFTRTVDDQIYTQPLIATNVNLGARGTHNIVIVATVNDSVYAFDADDASVAAAYWTRSFIQPPDIVPPCNIDTTSVVGGYNDFSGRVGIVGTPVIDPGAGTIYLVARTKEHGSNFVQRLHALDITSGAERPNSPVVITASCAGQGGGSVSGVIQFDPLRNNQRAGLALVNGVVYIGWASHSDWGPYHGWLLGYDAASLQRTIVYNTTPDGNCGGIWMSGAAPAADPSGNLYISVGNGSVGSPSNPDDIINRGESFLKLTRTGTNLSVASWFTPYNWKELEQEDNDLGCAGILLIPGTTLAFSGSKEGKAYLVDRDNMGGLSRGIADTNVVQSFQVTALVIPNSIHGGPVWWDGPDGSYTYIWGAAHYLRQYKFDRATGKFIMRLKYSSQPYAQSPTAAPVGMPGAMLSISANGTNSGTGILWASHPFSGNANQETRPGILHAYDAQNVASELWNSEQAGARDSVGNFAKYVSPTVANGKVYLATFSNRLNVYGLLEENPERTSTRGR